jgi:putative ABC transport system ATP-binding protein
MQDEPLIKLVNVSKLYQAGEMNVRALDNISLTINKGEMVAIMGASGSGKSTLMNLLGCLDRPTSGKYWLAGEDVSSLTDNELAKIRNKRIGFVFQSFNLLARTAAIENVELPLVYSGAKNRRELAIKALERVKLGGRATHKPSELSGGEQQRVAIARAIVTDPDIIMADEPTGNLDSKVSIEIMEIFWAFNQDGKTVVLVTHEDDIATFAGRIIRMVDGKIVSDITQIPRLASQPATAVK